jgi:hypothetical protein
MDNWPTGRQYRAAARRYREEAGAAPTPEIRDDLQRLAAEYEEIADLLDLDEAFCAGAFPAYQGGTA